MAWYGTQQYQGDATAEQAHAFNVMAEAYFSSRINSRVRDGDARKVRRIFDGTYQVADECSMNTGQIEWRAKRLTGIVFPRKLHSEFGYQPISFVFASNLDTNVAERNFSLVTGVPYVLNKEIPFKVIEGNIVKANLEGAYHSSFYSATGLWTLYWPTNPIIDESSRIVLKSGCDISLRKHYPSEVTAFIYFAKHQLGLQLFTDPDVDDTVRNDFRRDWELDFDVKSCFNAGQDRVAYWERAFNLRSWIPRGALGPTEID